MPEAPAESGNPFWDYSLSRYAAPGVAQACIDLQDRLGLDVNLLLFCCWAGHRGHRLSAAELERLLAASHDWQEEIVRPLRALRRRLKPQVGSASEVGALYESFKQLELDAERIAQDRLQRCLPLAAGAANEKALAANLALYLASVSVEVGEAEAAAFATLRDSCL